MPLYLLNSHRLGSFPPHSLLLLDTLFEAIGRSMISTNVVEILDLVESYDPVLTGEDFLDCVERWTDIWHLDATNTILRLSWREEGVVVVIRHFVPVCNVSFITTSNHPQRLT